MHKPFIAAKITDNVYWVGAIDWSLRDFHGYSTGRGTTYDTMWKSTEIMARSIADGMMEKGVEVKLLPLSEFYSRGTGCRVPHHE
ncbi:MAG: hypothetical protein JXB88_17070 [Spirochaetales bacterium]|nr:hypothetical protein [Spirochaetales bacterium]